MEKIDIVTQAELRNLFQLQIAAWHARTDPFDSAHDIWLRMEDGAEAEAGSLEFDPDLMMVRTRLRQ